MRFDGLLAQLRGAPSDGRVAAALATLAHQIGREEEALAPVARATATIGASAVLWQWTGLLARAVDAHEQAIAAYRKAAAIAPRDLRIAHGLALVTLEAGLPAEAAFEAALTLAPLDGGLLTGRASARFAAGRLDVAIEELDAVLAEHPGWIEGHETIARLRWLGGDRAALTASVDRALAEAPGDANLRTTRLLLLQHAGRFEEMRAAAAEARARAGPNVAFDRAEAAAASELGDVVAADAVFARLPSGDVAGAVWHVRHLLRQGRIEVAAALAQPWVARPDGRSLWPYLGTVWRMLGDARWQWLEGDPALVGIADLDVGPLDALAERLRGLHRARQQHLEQSVRGGTQTDEALFSRIEPEIRRLRDALVAAVEAHVARLPPRDPRHPTLSARRDRPVRFSGSWSVRLSDAGFHVAHVHSEGWLSSAFYVALPADMAGQGEAHAGWLALGAPPAELGLDLPPSRVIEPKPGRLVLFPSTMWHGTVPFACGERLTVAFDIARPRD